MTFTYKLIAPELQAAITQLTGEVIKDRITTTADTIAKNANTLAIEANTKATNELKQVVQAILDGLRDSPPRKPGELRIETIAQVMEGDHMSYKVRVIMSPLDVSDPNENDIVKRAVVVTNTTKGSDPVTCTVTQSDVDVTGPCYTTLQFDQDDGGNPIIGDAGDQLLLQQTDTDKSGNDSEVEEVTGVIVDNVRPAKPGQLQIQTIAQV